MELNLTTGTLEEQINFLKTIFDTIPFPIFIKNLNLEYVYINKICAEKNGVKPEDLVGKKTQIYGINLCLWLMSITKVI